LRRSPQSARPPRSMMSSIAAAVYRPWLRCRCSTMLDYRQSHPWGTRAFPSGWAHLRSCAMIGHSEVSRAFLPDWVRQECLTYWGSIWAAQERRCAPSGSAPSPVTLSGSTRFLCLPDYLPCPFQLGRKKILWDVFRTQCLKHEISCAAGIVASAIRLLSQFEYDGEFGKEVGLEVGTFLQALTIRHIYSPWTAARHLTRKSFSTSSTASLTSSSVPNPIETRSPGFAFRGLGTRPGSCTRDLAVSCHDPALDYCDNGFASKNQSVEGTVPTLGVELPRVDLPFLVWINDGNVPCRTRR